MKLVCIDADGLAFIDGHPWKLVPIQPTPQQIGDFPIRSVAEDVYDRMLARAPNPTQDPGWHAKNERQPPEDEQLLVLLEKNLDASILPAVYSNGRYICKATQQTLDAVMAWKQLFYKAEDEQKVNIT